MLEIAIPQEARRLLALAEAEIERRRQAYVGFHDATVWPRVAADLRRKLRMDALALAATADPESRDAAALAVPGVQVVEPLLPIGVNVIGPVAAAIIALWAKGDTSSDEDDDRRNELLDAAEALPATTGNVLAKALAVAWLEHAQEERPGSTRDKLSFTGRLTHDINQVMPAFNGEGTAAEPDAALVTLEAEFLAADAAVSLAFAVEAEAMDARAEIEVPVALKVLNGDILFNGIPQTEIIPLGGGKGRMLPYGKTEVDFLRANPCTAVYVGGGEGEVVADGHGRRRPDARAQKRADEIMVAWDEWQVQVTAAREAVDLPLLEAAAKAAVEARDAVLQQIRETPARSLTGLAVKARVAANMLAETDIKASGLDCFECQNGDAYLYDLAGDVLALTGGLPAAHQ